MRIGYACINSQLKGANRTCRLRNATPEKIRELSAENLQSLSNFLEWNLAHDIALFRISSDIIPFASHAINRLEWWKIFEKEFHQTGNFIRENDLRVSMHPGQYTVLNSPNPKVAKNALAELEYHTRFLNALNLNYAHKMIIHVGGVFNDRPKSLTRFAENFKRLSESAQKRLIIENDEKCYPADDVLALSERINVPVVFDVFHHDCFPEKNETPIEKIISNVMTTWKPEDGRPKLHYSNQWPGKPPGAHSQVVDVADFKKFYQNYGELELDVMLEVKNKEASVLALYKEIPELKQGVVL